MIRDHSDHGRSNEPMNPCPEWIHQLIWSTVIRVISDHWSFLGSSQRNAALVTWILRRKSIWQCTCSHDWRTLRLGLGVVFGSWYWKTYPYDYPTLPSIPLPHTCAKFGLYLSAKCLISKCFFLDKVSAQGYTTHFKRPKLIFLCKVVKILIQWSLSAAYSWRGLFSEFYGIPFYLALGNH